MVHIISNKNEFDISKYDYVVLLLKNELKQEPFSQLKTDQRRILKNLENSIIKKDSATAIYNLAELNDVLINTNNQINKLERENNWALPLGIVGLILTLLFGIMTVLSPISYKKMKDIIENSVNRKK